MNENECDKIKIKSHDCFFTIYKGELQHIFYIELKTLMKLLEMQKQDTDNFLKQLLKNENENEVYILKIRDFGLPYIPVQKEIIQQLIYNGVLLENLDIDKFVEKYNSEFPYVTYDYMKNLVIFLNIELEKTNNQLKKYNYLNNINSDTSDTDSDSDSDTSNTSDSDI